MFVAVAFLQINDFSKSTIIGGPSAGLLLGFFIVAVVRRSGISVNIAAGGAWILAAGGYATVALFPQNKFLFVIGVVLALLAHALASPMESQIYKRHYPDRIRGRLFSIVGMVRSTAAAGFGYLAGLWLLRQGVNYAPLFWLFSLCSVLSAGFTLGMKPVYLRKTQKLSLFQAFTYLRDDRRFRKLINSWMVLGMGNLLCIALFVEYITNPIYGFGYQAGNVSFITTTLPMVVFIISVFGWGIIYDRMEFYRLRLMVNVFFLLGILVYFFSPNFTGLCIGMALHGIGKAGGNILWSLWTTKFAPSDKVSEYMSIHTLFTGVRGGVSAYAAFAIAQSFGPTTVAVIGACCIIIASLMLLPEVKENWKISE